MTIIVLVGRCPPERRIRASHLVRMLLPRMQLLLSKRPRNWVGRKHNNAKSVALDVQIKAPPDREGAFAVQEPPNENRLRMRF